MQRVKHVVVAAVLCLCLAFGAAAIAQTSNETGGSGNPAGNSGSSRGSSGQQGGAMSHGRSPGSVPGQGGGSSAGGGVGTDSGGGIKAWHIGLVVLVLAGVVVVARITRKRGPGTGAGETTA